MMNRRITVDTWVASLRSGTGDYKIMFTEDYLVLLAALGLNTEADDNLLRQFQAIKDHPVTRKYTPEQARKFLLEQIKRRDEAQR